MARALTVKCRRC